jgi:hypothetical protein
LDAPDDPVEDPHEFDLATDEFELDEDDPPPQLELGVFDEDDPPQLELDFGTIAGDDFEDDPPHDPEDFDPEETDGDDFELELPQELDLDPPEELPLLPPPQLPPLEAADTSAAIKRERSRNADTIFFIFSSNQ